MVDSQHIDECELLTVDGKRPTHFNETVESMNLYDLPQAKLESLADHYKKLEGIID